MRVIYRHGSAIFQFLTAHQYTAWFLFSKSVVCDIDLDTDLKYAARNGHKIGLTAQDPTPVRSVAFLPIVNHLTRNRGATAENRMIKKHQADSEDILCPRAHIDWNSLLSFITMFSMYKQGYRCRRLLVCSHGRDFIGLHSLMHAIERTKRP